MYLIWFLPRENRFVFFKKWSIPGLFFVYFSLIKQILQYLQQIYVQNVHPVYGVGIRTHDFRHMSLLPKPLDQGRLECFAIVEKSMRHFNGQMFPFLFDAKIAQCGRCL